MSLDALAIAPLERPPDAVVDVPGSKSLSNRVLLIAALCPGRSVIDGALFSDDTSYMAAGLRILGAGVTEEPQRARFVVDGVAEPWPAKGGELFAGNAGTAMRFLAAAACLGHGRFRLDGTERMRQRPIGDLVDGLKSLGAEVRCELAAGCPPVVVDAHGLPGGATEIEGSRSSQFLSAVLLVASYAHSDVTVRVPGTLIAQPYIDMTIGVMREFGVEVERDGYREFRVRCGQRYRAHDHQVEPDASGAHYFLAAAALAGGRVRVPGLGRRSVQGDMRFVDLLEQMGAAVDWTDDGVEVRGPDRLSGIDADMNAISDTAPTLAVLGAFASSPVSIRNIEHVRWQESDRLHAVATELQRLGVRVEERKDGLTVWPSEIRPADIHTYDDHRIAMAFSLAGLMAKGVRILDPKCVAKTFPGYFEALAALRR